MHSVFISAPSRLHVTLCDLGRATPRAYGGLGFAIYEPRVEIRVTVGSGNIILPAGSDEAALAGLTSLILELKERTSGTLIDVEVVQMPAQHSGLGTKTALLLSTLYGANELLTLGLSNRDMQLLSGRGGTSGVGVHTFFGGGLVWDAGHQQAAIKKFGPSRYHRPTTIPPCLARLEMPANWAICLLQVEGATPSGEEELALFSRAAPLPADETLKLIGWVVHGLLPAVAEQDLSELAVALASVTQTGFKAREVAEQSAEVQKLLSELQSRSIPSGMSSLGPTVFALATAEDCVAREQIEEVGKQHGANWIWTHPDNRGAVLSVEQ